MSEPLHPAELAPHLKSAPPCSRDLSLPMTADNPALPVLVRVQRLIAVLRAPTNEHVLAAARALLDVGVRCIEITLTTPGALDVIERLASEVGREAAIGAGSIRSSLDVRDAADAGAQYLLAPHLDHDFMIAAREHSIPMIPGAATPSEIAAAARFGCPAVKVFPAALLGGPEFIRSVRDPMPEVALIPTGGVNQGSVPDYLTAGAVAVGVGTPLFGDALITGDLTTIAKRGRQFLAAAEHGSHHAS